MIEPATPTPHRPSVVQALFAFEDGSLMYGLWDRETGWFEVQPIDANERVKKVSEQYDDYRARAHREAQQSFSPLPADDSGARIELVHQNAALLAENTALQSDVEHWEKYEAGRLLKEMEGLKPVEFSPDEVPAVATPTQYVDECDKLRQRLREEVAAKHAAKFQVVGLRSEVRLLEAEVERLKALIRELEAQR